MNKKIILTLCIGLMISACTKTTPIIEIGETPTLTKQDNTHVISVDSLSKIALNIPNQFSTNKLTKSIGKTIKEIIPFSHFSTAQKTKSTAIDPTENIYIVNYTNNQGFAIMSADDRIPQVLGYSDEGNITDTTRNPGLKIIMDLIPQYGISLMYDDGDEPSPFPPDTLRKDTIYEYSPWSVTTVGPFITTKWHQGEPLNNKTPICEDSNDNMVTGCGPLALTMVLSYYKYPTVVNGINIDWDSINSYVNNWSLLSFGSPNLKNQISEVTHSIGVAAGVNYGCSATESNFGRITKVLLSYGYTKDEGGYNTDNVYSSILNNKIILICGYADRTWLGFDKEGHNWVIDGYMRKNRAINIYEEVLDTYDKVQSSELIGGYLEDYKYVHCNFGWAGTSNGWYISQIFDTTKTPILDEGCQVNPGTENYQYSLRIVYNITKPNN